MEVIKYEGSLQNDWLLYKYPGNNFTNRTKLIVAPGQVAIFIKQGAICDVFEAGGHTLSTENIPILGKLVNMPFKGETPFTAEVMFVNVTKRLNTKWGTREPISLIDPMFNINVDVRAYGTYSTQIKKPKEFLQSLVGYFGDDLTLHTNDIADRFQSLLMTSIKTEIAKEIIDNGESVLEITRKLHSISDNLNIPIKALFKQYGISLDQFNVESINYPKEDMERIKEALKAKAEQEILGTGKKFCTNCGAEVSREAKFCQECGGQL